MPCIENDTAIIFRRFPDPGGDDANVGTLVLVLRVEPQLTAVSGFVFWLCLPLSPIRYDGDAVPPGALVAIPDCVLFPLMRVNSVFEHDGGKPKWQV